jgi:hypothetical protein
MEIFKKLPEKIELLSDRMQRTAKAKSEETIAKNRKHFSPRSFQNMLASMSNDHAQKSFLLVL